MVSVLIASLRKSSLMTVFSPLSSLSQSLEFQIWCELTKHWGSLRLLGRGSNFRVIIIFRIIFSSSKGGSFFTYAMHVLCTPRKAEIMFFKLIFSLRKIRKKIFFANQNIFLFLGPMHTQEARNNVFPTDFLIAGKFGKKIFRSRQNIIFSQVKI